jgi:hypothetical protein
VQETCQKYQGGEKNLLFLPVTADGRKKGRSSELDRPLFN